MREFARKLYSSKRWQKTRAAYKKSVGGLCERCWKNGVIKAGEIVHHKIPLTPENINDPNIALSFDNLELVCRDCHAEIHEEVYERKRGRRYTIDEFGRVTAI